MQRVKLIYNPHAGQMKPNLLAVIQALQERFEVSVYITRKALDATRETKRTKEKIVLAMGGDGTVNEVINGLKKDQTLGIIPCGTSNVLAKEFGIPRNAVKAAKQICKLRTIKIDVGYSNKKRFFMTTGIGFDASAITKVRSQFKKVFGELAYYVATLEALRDYKPVEMKVTLDHKKVVHGHFVVINNLLTYGHVLKLTPDPDFSDGKLDVVVIKTENVMKAINYLGKAALKNPQKQDGIFFSKAKHIKISSKKPVLFHRDAEISGTTPVTVTVKKRALKLLY